MAAPKTDARRSGLRDGPKSIRQPADRPPARRSSIRRSGRVPHGAQVGDRHPEQAEPSHRGGSFEIAPRKASGAQGTPSVPPGSPPDRQDGTVPPIRSRSASRRNRGSGQTSSGSGHSGAAGPWQGRGPSIPLASSSSSSTY